MIDLRRVFARTMQEEIERVFESHGIDVVYEDQYQETIDRCVDEAYQLTVDDLRRARPHVVVVGPIAYEEVPLAKR